MVKIIIIFPTILSTKGGLEKDFPSFFLLGNFDCFGIYYRKFKENILVFLWAYYKLFKKNTNLEKID